MDESPAAPCLWCCGDLAPSGFYYTPISIDRKRRSVHLIDDLPVRHYSAKWVPAVWTRLTQ